MNTSETCTFCSSGNITLPKTAYTKRPVEEYEVDGEARESLSSSMDEPVKKKPRRQVVKECRRLGKEFRSEKSSKVVNNRNAVKPRCTSRYCLMKGMGCSSVDEERRQDINRSYYSMGSLEEQRQ